jgi:hypothetical protein
MRGRLNVLGAHGVTGHAQATPRRHSVLFDPCLSMPRALVDEPPAAILKPGGLHVSSRAETSST